MTDVTRFILIFMIHINKHHLRHTTFGVGVAVLLIMASALTAYADSATFDFESYALGTINGQAGWLKAGGYDVAVSPSLGVVGFGVQSLRISNAVTSGSFGDQTFSPSLTNEAGETAAENGGLSGGTRQNTFVAEWDFASVVPGVEQPGLAVTVSPDRGDGARMSFIRMKDTATGLAVDFADYQTGGPGFVTTAVASDLDRSVSHNVRLEMDFVDGAANDVVRVYVDGILVHTGTSWEDYFRDFEGNETRTVDSLLFRVSGTAAPATNGAGFLIDNVALESLTPVVNPDVDDDGVLNDVDKCEGTVADVFPQYGNKQAKNRFMLNASDVWVTNAKPGTMGGFAPTIADTYGCSGMQILDAMSEATGLDFGGEYKFGITKGTLEAWIAGEYYVGKTLVDTVVVNSALPTGANSLVVLDDENDYFLKASGTWTNRGVELVDAEFSNYNNLGWVDGPDGGYPADLIDLQVNNAFVTWGSLPASPTNSYEIPFAPLTDGVVNFRVFDHADLNAEPDGSWYGDNVGSLTVEIYEDLYIDLW